jgi:tetratricopeptide (TPR) repeat protein
MGDYEPAGVNLAVEKSIKLIDKGEFADSRKFLSQILEQFPQSAEAYALLSQISLLKGDHEQAKGFLSKARSISVDSPLVLLNSSRLFLKEGRTKEALKHAWLAFETTGASTESKVVLSACLGANQEFSKAQSLVEEVIESGARSAEAYANRALLRLRSNDLNGATTDAKTAVEIKPHLAQVWALLGKMRFQEGKVAEAIFSFEKALEHEPENSDYLTDTGELFLRSSNSSKASKLLQKATVVDPRSSRAWLLLGAAYESSGSLKEARTALLTALHITPSSPQVLNNLGTIERKSGDIHSAIDYLNRARELDGSIPETYNNLGMCYAALGRISEAEESFSEAVSLKPDYYDALCNLAELYKCQLRNFESEFRFRDAISCEPSALKAHLGLCTLLAERGRVEDAKKQFRTAISALPDSPAMHINHASFLIRTDRFLEAEESLKTAIRLEPQSSLAYFYLGILYKAIGDRTKAKLCYTRAVEIDCSYFEAYLNLGKLLSEELGRFDEALHCINKAIEIQPDSAEAHINLSNLLAEHGELEKAEIVAKKAILLDETLPHAYANLGNLQKGRGDFREAILNYEKSLSIDPDYIPAHYNLSLVKEFNHEDLQYKKMQSLCRNESVPDIMKSRIFFALGKAAEDMGQQEVAFGYYVKGNAIRKKQLNYQIEDDRSLFEKLKNNFAFLSNLIIEKSSSTPCPIFIVGMPRSGTTLVEQVISSHSGVFGAGELMYVRQYGGAIAEGREEVSKEDVKRFRNLYHSKLKDFDANAQFITDKMPLNFRYLGLICTAFPDAKVIHTQRDPSAVCWSNFKTSFSNDGIGFSYSIGDVKAYYRLYSELMEFWLAQFPNQIYTLNYDRFTCDQERETKLLMDFLRLPWEIQCLAPQENSRRIATASNMQVRQKVFKGSSESWKKFRPYLNGALDIN